MEDDEYYDIDSILAEQIKIPCIFLHDLDGQVNITGDGSSIQENTRLELPFWMAKPLALFRLHNTEHLVTLEMPKSFGQKVRNALDANASSVDFRLLCPYFYLFGTKLLQLIVDNELPVVLEKAFKARLRDIMDHSQTATSNIGQDFLFRLDETEKELFKAGQEGFSQLRHWRNRGLQKLKAADIASRTSSQS